MHEAVSCFAVNCRFCGNPIPLAQFDESLYYRLADSFVIQHDEQVLNSNCNARGVYSSGDLRRLDFIPLPGLVPNLGFAKKIMPKN
jgi:hypothetical protein